MSHSTVCKRFIFSFYFQQYELHITTGCKSRTILLEQLITLFNSCFTVKLTHTVGTSCDKDALSKLKSPPLHTEVISIQSSVTWTSCLNHNLLNNQTIWFSYVEVLGGKFSDYCLLTNYIYKRMTQHNNCLNRLWLRHVFDVCTWHIYRWGKGQGSHTSSIYLLGGF